MSKSSLISNIPYGCLCPYEQFQKRDDTDSNEINFALIESVNFEREILHIYVRIWRLFLSNHECVHYSCATNDFQTR